MTTSSATKRTPCPHRCCGGHACALDNGPHAAHERCICDDPACVCHDAAAYGLERVTVRGLAQYRTVRLLAVPR